MAFLFGLSILMLFTVVPVKIGAELTGADNNGIQFCGLAVLLGSALSFLCFNIIGGLLGAIAAFIAVALVYSKIFNFSFAGGMGFSVAVLFIQIGLIQALSEFGIVLLNISMT